jgi:hypothetical protein
MKTKHLFYLIAVIAIGYVACKSKEDKKATPTTATIPTVDTTVAEEEIDSGSVLENVDTFSTIAFSSYAKKQSSSFDWSRFRMEHSWVDTGMLVQSYTPDQKFYEAYGRFIKYSPDSTMFIDLDSYNVGMKKDSKGKWVGTEYGPDSEVSLVNLQTKQKIRLLFMGPDGSVEDGLWLDKDNLALIGVEDSGDSTGKVAAVWKINIPSKSYYLYTLRDSVTARRLIGYWRKERLKGVMVN